ncbi:MAG: mechanosensitive ion channel family protein [Pseudomonadota bacterium]
MTTPTDAPQLDAAAIIGNAGQIDWVETLVPILIRMASAGACLLVVWLMSAGAKSLVRFIGRKRMASHEVFDGSTWDLGGSLIQFFILLASIPLILALAGVNTLPFLTENAVGIVSAFLILFAGILLSRWFAVSIRSFGHRAAQNQNADDTLFQFLASMGRYLGLGLAVILALQQLGFSTGSLIAVVGAAGLALALALQDTLRAVAAGVMLAVFRPFRVGDWVEISGLEGEVTEVTPFHTTIKTVDHRSVILPNDKAWAEPITNYSAHAERRVDFYVDISYEDDIGKALDLLRATIAETPGCRRANDIWVSAHKLGDFGVTLRARAYVAKADFITFRGAITKRVKEAFEQAGITIPFPQQVEYSRPWSSVSVQIDETSNAGDDSTVADKNP